MRHCLHLKCFNFVHLSGLGQLFTALLIISATFTGVNGTLPEASQEGPLHPYKSYADVTLFHYYVPMEVSRVTWEFAAFMDGSNCPSREVHIHLQHGSYPVINPDNSSFPDNLYSERTSLYSFTLKSAYQLHETTVFPVYSPLPGNWFVAAYMPHWDQQVQQEGISHKCHYNLGSIALWSQVPNIPLVSLDAENSHTTDENMSYYKFYVPAGIWRFTLKLSDCQFHATATPPTNATEKPHFCIEGIVLQGRALPMYNTDDSHGAISEGESYDIEITHPYTESYYYLLVVSEYRVTFHLEITTKECGIEVLGRSFARQFAQITESISQITAGGTTTSSNVTRMDWVSTLLSGNSSDIRTKGGSSGQCLPIFQLARIKHVQDFSDTFLLQGREWFTTWLALTDHLPVIVQLDILPFMDIGGTLSVNVHLDELLLNATFQLLTISACISKGRPVDYKDGHFICNSDLLMNITSHSLSTIDSSVLIPFPEPDKWYILFETKCYYEGREVTCAFEEIMVSLDVRTQPCVFSGEPCGHKGLCQESHKGQFFFTSCTCLGGYRGWACTDASQATSEGMLLLMTLLLTLSNIFFLPAVILAIRRRLYTEALVYTSTMVFSALYHACDEDFYGYCITKYEVLQFCDFFCSILAFWVTLIAMAGFPSRYSSTLHMLGVLVIAVGVEYNRTGLVVFILPFALGVSIPLSVWAVRSFKKHTCLVEKSWFLFLTPGICLAGIGLLLFAFVETEENYQYIHSAWHVVIALSLVFLLPRVPHSKASYQYMTDTHSGNDSELLDVNERSTSSPVFFVTSELDSLHPTQPNSR